MKLAAIVIGVLILTTGAAAYQVYAVTRPSSPSVPAPVFSYDQLRNYSFVAQVLPSQLYNSTTIAGGNVTLFTALTQSINVSYEYTVVTTVPTVLSLDQQLTVRIQTPAWSKLLHSTVSRHTFPQADRFVITNFTVLNVSALVALESEISNETGVISGTWAIAVVPSFSGTLVGGGSGAFVELAAPIWFNVTQGEIAPGGFNATQSGSVPGTGDASGGSSAWTSLAALLSYALLAASVSGLGVAAVWLQSSGKAAPDQELARLTRPYSEVIVGTRTRPRPSETIRLSRWEDIVKVADTTGRPILRIEGAGDSGPGRTFCVLDGGIGYFYLYTGSPGGLERATDPRERTEPTKGPSGAESGLGEMPRRPARRTEGGGKAAPDSGSTSNSGR